MEMQDLVPVYSAADPITAEIIKNMLDAEGIRCFIDGENQAQLTGLTTMEIKILVEPERADEARKLIEEHEAGASADAEAEDEEAAPTS
jgi:Putative prokaryotic signal transducing protein